MVDKKLLSHVAALCRIHLSPAEMDALLPQLSEVLDAFSALRKVDTKNIAPSFHPIPLQPNLRDDVPLPCLGQEEALANAPHQKDGYFQGPRVVEQKHL
ncbi:MAG TPA: Asp-tRNA(Asn)/Glu-tRNA(Gln) amidotransferase subunit GatC [Candidatus Nanoarchaeia archaeon]|nr:Asp-tRNA(Asn)/Glu-tRNA(Gln) amidotransferase subunit GatC [Candidatus Nanoarchaeia archaeon]